ncbi:MAG: hypothetical protein FJX75_27745 [Armatimonadetes bacterium]|nr:hypothetical protein [Armatimonadota bacterium]
MRRAISVGLFLVCLGPVAGQQRLTLKCADMALPDVVKMLRQTSGVLIVGADTADAETPRITLSLTDVTVRQALGEVCKQAGWHYEPLGQGYRLMPGPREPKPFVCRVGDYDVILDRVIISRNLAIELIKAEPQTTLDHRLSLGLIAESDDEEQMVAVAGFDPQVTAMTDTGVELRESRNRFTPLGYYSREPVVRGSINLPPPPEEARSLARIEGDLILFAKVERTEYEFPLDEVGQTREQDGVSVTFRGFDPATGTAQVQAKIARAPDEEPGRMRSPQPRCAATLVDADGRPAPSGGYSSSGRGEDGVYTSDQEFRFRLEPGFEPAKLKYQMILTRDPSERLTYVFENIPLPLEENVKPPIEQLP